MQWTVSSPTRFLDFLCSLIDIEGIAMPYAKNYDLGQVKGMLQIAENSANIKAFRAFAASQAKKGKVALLSKAPVAHAAGLHAEQTADALANRVDTGPVSASTFKDFDTLALATLEGLNHANGQAALALLDGGAIDATFRAPLAGGMYYASRSTRIGPKKSGVSTQDPFMIATEVFIKVVAYVGGNLWIQTSYPSVLNARPAPTLAALP
jgi:hypothetical protein